MRALGNRDQTQASSALGAWGRMHTHDEEPLHCIAHGTHEGYRLTVRGACGTHTGVCVCERERE